MSGRSGARGDTPEAREARTVTAGSLGALDLADGMRIPARKCVTATRVRRWIWGVITVVIGVAAIAAFGDVRKRDRGVRLIGLAATNLARASAPDLFEAPEREKLRRLSAAMDEVREKYGFDAMQPGRLLELKRRRDPPG